MHILVLAFRSVLNRKFTLLMTIFSIALSILLLLGVERLRTDARESFANTISGTDLIVGARSGPVQLLLYSVFRIGNPTNNVSWESYLDVKQQRLVAWTIPLSLGDSHRGFRVLGTNTDYFEHYRYAGDRGIEFAAGRPFSAVLEAVIGADVAEELGYAIGQEIVLSHGAGKVSFLNHDNAPFRVTGILEKTGTPLDRTVHVGLSGIEAIHVGWEGGAPSMRAIDIETALQQDLQPKNLTAFLVGLKSRVAVFQLQRYVNDYPEEALTAVLPGVALAELWDTMAIAQQALLIISILVVLVGITGMATAILTSLEERRREMAILRSVGARPWQILLLFVGESGAIMVISALLGMTMLYLLQFTARPILQAQIGLYLPIHSPSAYEILLLSVAIAAGILVGLIPAIRAYRYSLADGLTIRI